MAIYKEFPGNEPACSFTYVRTREGPNGFVCFYKNSATIKLDPKDAWRTLGVAKFTDSGKALKEWCLSMHEQYGKTEEAEGRADTSFASEVKAEEDPTANTRMVT